VNEEAVELIMQYYGYNVTKAETAAAILTPAQIEILKDNLRTGGPDNANKKRPNR